MQITKYKGFKHFADRDPKRQIKYLVVHSFALSIRDMIKTCNKLGVGPHYIIDTKGHIIQLVPENKTAWHAGKSFWRGEESLNGASVGIELQNKTLGQSKYPEAQMKAFIWLAKSIMKRHKILPQNVVGHSDIAPTRKADPGIQFPWAEMAKYGIGIWPQEAMRSVSRAKSETLLKRIGYDTTDKKAAMYAFMRRFMPKLVPVDKDIKHIEENLHNYIVSVITANKEVYSCLCCVAKAYTQKGCAHVGAFSKQK